MIPKNSGKQQSAQQAANARASSVDVVVPCYQYGRFLRGCVGSVLSQKVGRLHVLIIDNASTDNSREVAQQLARENGRIELVLREKNLGPTASYNEGLDWVSADYFVILDADDLLAPGCLERAISVMDQNPDVTFTHGVELCAAFGPGEMPDIEPSATREEWRVSTGSAFIEHMFRVGANSIGAPTAVRRTSAQKQIGYYRPELSFTDDLEMWLRLAMIGDVAETTATQGIRRVHPQQVTAAYREVHVRDYQEHYAAFLSFLAHEGKTLANARRLRHTVEATLAKGAFWTGLRHFSEGDERNGEDTIQFALALRPDLILPRLARRVWELDEPVKRLAGFLGATLRGTEPQEIGQPRR